MKTAVMQNACEMNFVNVVGELKCDNLMKNNWVSLCVLLTPIEYLSPCYRKDACAGNSMGETSCVPVAGTSCL
jgi:hypothetical protein